MSKQKERERKFRFAVTQNVLNLLFWQTRRGRPYNYPSFKFSWYQTDMLVSWRGSYFKGDISDHISSHASDMTVPPLFLFPSVSETNATVSLPFLVFRQTRLVTASLLFHCCFQ